MNQSVSKEDVEKGIKKIFEYVAKTQNLTSRFIIIIALASLWIDAFDFSGFSLVLGSFVQTFHPPAFWLGFSVAAINIGAAFGAFIGGYMTDRLGRRIMFIINMILFVVMALLAGLSTNLYEFIIFRIGLGFALGADVATAFTYIFEFLEEKQRLFWSNLWQAQWYIMYYVTILVVIFPMYFITHSLTNPILWRIIMFGGAALAFIILILRSKIPESILWKAYKGNLKDAKEILKKTYGVDLADVPDVNYDLGRSLTFIKNLRLVYRIKKWREWLYSYLGSFEQCIVSWGFGQYLPYILIVLAFKGPLATLEAELIFYGAGLIAGFLVAYLTRKIGTKTQYVIGAILEGIAIIFFGIVFQYKLPFALLIGFASMFFFFHVIGPASQATTSAGAFFGARERGTAEGWTYQYCKTAGVISAFAFPLLLVSVGMIGLTYILGFFAIAVGVLGIFIGYDAMKYKNPDLEEVR
ncbi:MAG: MFS transporter [Caldisphaera sp.]